MRFAIFGSGGVGGYFGGRLAQAGQNVTFIARGRHLIQMKESGLRVDSIGGDFVLKSVSAADSPQSIGAVDCVILAVKAWQLGEAIGSMKPLIGAETIILPLMNGIEHMDLLTDTFGREHVLGGLCRISSFLAGPGHITHVGVKPFISFGELDNTVSGRVRDLQEIFNSLVGIDVDVPSDIRAAMWEKFIFICSTSGVGAVTRQPIGVYRSVPESRAMLESALKEVVEIGRARGVALPENLLEMLMQRIDRLPEGMLASMQKDIMEGRPSELDAQTGAVVRMGHALGLPMPTHTFIYAGLLPMEMAARDA